MPSLMSTNLLHKKSSAVRRERVVGRRGRERKGGRKEREGGREGGRE